MSDSAQECVKVAVRCRPLNSKEKGMAAETVVGINAQTRSVSLKKPGAAPGEENRTFTYDFCYGVDSNQQQVYDDCSFGLVESVLEGYNGTIFAYGQTGCGKSHTMMGVLDPALSGGVDLKGIIPKSVAHIFGAINDNTENGKKKYLVRCSYLEIYNESILDLLPKKKEKSIGGGPDSLKIKEDPDRGIYVQDLQKEIVKTTDQLLSLIDLGLSRRKVGETAMNKDSSRSHSIFTVYIEMSEEVEIEGASETYFKAGKLNLVDLAGSERQSKTQATGDRLKEANKINLSLSALGNVISALVDGKSHHVPYRDSKLTRLLQDSLGGNTKTVMIAAVSPADYNFEETLSTLRYASRAKNIKNKPTINEDPKDALLKQYEAEIQQLKQMLADMNAGGKGVNMAQVQAQIQQVQSVQQTPPTRAVGKEQKAGAVAPGAQKTSEATPPNVSDFNNQKQKKQASSPQDQPCQKMVKPESLKEITGLLSKIEMLGASVAQTDMSESSQKNEVQETPSRLVENNIREDRSQKSNNQSGTDSQLAERVRQKEEDLKNEVQAKLELETKLQLLQAQLSVGADTQQAKEKEQQKKYRKFQRQLKTQKAQEELLRKEKEKKEEEMLMVQKTYETAAAEVDDLRQKVTTLQQRYKHHEQELSDQRKEHVDEKQDLILGVRSLNDELKFYKQVVGMVLRPDELKKVRRKTTYDENAEEWSVPPFIFKQKEIVFPRLNGAAMVNNAMGQRELELINQGREEVQSQISTIDSTQRSSNNNKDAARNARQKSESMTRHKDASGLNPNNMFNGLNSGISGIEDYQSKQRYNQSKKDMIDALSKNFKQKILRTGENSHNGSGISDSTRRANFRLEDHANNPPMNKGNGAEITLAHLDLLSLRKSGEKELVFNEVNLARKNRLQGVTLAPINHPSLATQSSMQSHKIPSSYNTQQRPSIHVLASKDATSVSALSPTSAFSRHLTNGLHCGSPEAQSSSGIGLGQHLTQINGGPAHGHFASPISPNTKPPLHATTRSGYTDKKQL